MGFSSWSFPLFHPPRPPDPQNFSFFNIFPLFYSYLSSTSHRRWHDSPTIIFDIINTLPTSCLWPYSLSSILYTSPAPRALKRTVSSHSYLGHPVNGDEKESISIPGLIYMTRSNQEGTVTDGNIG